MQLVRKLTTGAIAAGLAATGFIAATPADALVVNSSCSLSSVVKVNYVVNGKSGAYCYVWDGNKASGYVGAMNIQGAVNACSGSYVGYVQDTLGRQYPFNRYGCTKPIGGATLSLIVFSGN
ncbi:hypothetical protein [Kitasatospora sp. A2-31]|uniref:hypothetical protein n=1 Tax=Kitasatospora sp. A2-31 TaxID=2916414 RepID=UPI001EEA9565|nr:hypothetical protein [Kitasatospora sp. A2-31]MCG6497744.1 hypothetical protein [Kitasatospora sp. A2-31]